MTLLPNNQIQELLHFCSISDMEIRSDLILGYIINENDYTSNFTGALRRNINSYSQTGLRATSHLLTSQEEKGTGCDAAIIIKTGNTGKVLLLEGKWPRLSNPFHHWDWKQTSTGLSHFSDQLSRQANFAKRYAIAEMFYDECAFGSGAPHMQPHGSVCVWHEDAIAYDLSRTNSPMVWSQSELVTMLQKGTHSIAHIVQQVCLCYQGTVLNLPDTLRLNALDFPLPSSILVITGEESNKSNNYAPSAPDAVNRAGF